jgi:hypothetical protein
VVEQHARQRGGRCNAYGLVIEENFVSGERPIAQLRGCAAQAHPPGGDPLLDFSARAETRRGE